MIWFKNIFIYRLNKEQPLVATEIEPLLQPFAYTPCSSQESSATGWVNPFNPEYKTLLHSALGHILLCAYREEKILPTSVIKQTLQLKIQQIEQQQHKKLRKNEKELLKDEIVQQLLPRAFSRFIQTRIWIHSLAKLIIVEAASAKRAEDALALLRKSLGSLPVTPLTFSTPIEHRLTEWVQSGELPLGLILEDEAELQSRLEEGGTIRCKKQDLQSKEIKYHLESGKYVSKLALDWNERIRFILAEDGSLKRIRFSSLLKEQNVAIHTEDHAQRLDADFTLMTGELSSLVDHLLYLDA